MSGKLTINSLDHFGLTSYEARSYLSLLERSKLTGAEVARLAEVPRSRIYDTLEQLELKGLCQKTPGKVKLYSAVEPSQLKDVLVKLEKDRASVRIEKLQFEIEKEKEQLNDRIKEAETIANKLIPVFNESRSSDDSLDYIEIIRDADQIDKKATEFISQAEKEILSFCWPPIIAARKTIQEQLKFEKNIIQKGIDCIAIYEIPQDIKQTKWLREYLEEVSNIGEQVRIIDHVPFQMAIFDEKCTLLRLQDPVTLRYSMTNQIIRHSGYAAGLKTLFNAVWNAAQDKEELDDIIDKMENK